MVDLYRHEVFFFWVFFFSGFFLGFFSFLDCINGENIIFRTGFFFWIFFLFWTRLMVKIIFFVLVFFLGDGLMVNITFV